MSVGFDVGIAATVFAVIVPSELPDKTMVATLVLATRFRPLPVWVGVVAGFAVQSGVAVAAGGLLSLLPRRLVLAVTALLFLVGAWLLVRHAPDAASEEAEVAEEIAGVTGTSFRRAALTSFGVLFAAEWGDLTQLLTANFAARYAAPGEVFVGSFLALSLVAAIGVVAGRMVLRMVPLRMVQFVAAGLFVLLGIASGLEAAGVNLPVL